MSTAPWLSPIAPTGTVTNAMPRTSPLRARPARADRSAAWNVGSVLAGPFAVSRAPARSTITTSPPTPDLKRLASVGTSWSPGCSMTSSDNAPRELASR